MVRGAVRCVGLWAVAVLAGLGSAPPGSASVTRLGTLVAPGTGEALGPATISGDVVFSGAPDASFTAQAQGAVFVFDAGAAGAPVEHERARLIASDPAEADGLGGALAATGTTVVAGNSDPAFGRGKLWVFREPSSGWSGTVTQAATLVAPPGVMLHAPEISGSTVVAPGGPVVGGVVGVQKLYVFTEPATGWAGTILPSAVLTPSNGDGLGGGVAIDGPTIVAGDPSDDAAFVFTEPTPGWTGVVNESAVLTATDVSAQEHSQPGLVGNPGFGFSVALAGDDVVVGAEPTPPQVGNAYVFTKPAGGWRSETQTAELTDPNAHLLGFVPFSANARVISFDGSLAAITGAPIRSDGTDGPSAIYLYSEPAGGWHGVLTPSATLTPRDGSAVDRPAIAGSTVYTGSSDATTSSVVSAGPVDVFTEPPGGWSGTVHETAALAATSGTSPIHEGGVTAFTQMSLHAMPPGGWSDAAAAGALVPAGDPNLVRFDSVTASAGVAVTAGASDVYVFSKPLAGWGAAAPPVATLRDPSGGSLDQPKLSGDTVAALVGGGPSSGRRPPAIDLFVRPAAGWSGTIMPAASVTLPPGQEVEGFAYAEGTLAVALWTGQRSETEVFGEPSTGWAGALVPAARLDVPSGASSSLDVGRRTIIVGATGSGSTVAGRGIAYVFDEPALGWSGTVPRTATLAAPYWLENGAWVWSEPASGWHGNVRPGARLLTGDPVLAAATSGNGIALATFYGGSKYGCEACGSDLYVFSRPAKGWHGALAASRVATVAIYDTAFGTDTPALALDGNVAFYGERAISGSAATALDIFQIPQTVAETAITPGRPAVSGQSLRGIDTGSPTFRAKLTAGTNAPPIAAVDLTVPSGLALAAHRTDLRRGTRVCGLSIFTCTRLGPRVVRIATTAYSSSFALAIGPPALTEAPALHRRITALKRYNRAHRHHRSLRLRFALAITDALGHTSHTTVTETLRVSR